MNHQIRNPVVIKSNSSTQIRENNSNIINSIDNNDLSVRMSDSLMKKKGIKVTSSKWPTNDNIFHY